MYVLICDICFSLLRQKILSSVSALTLVGSEILWISSGEVQARAEEHGLSRGQIFGMFWQIEGDEHPGGIAGLEEYRT